MVLNAIDNVAHVTEVLFHWNCENNSDAINELHNINNISYQTDDFYNDDYDTEQLKDDISIIIPSKDNPELINTCLSGNWQRSFVKRTGPECLLRLYSSEAHPFLSIMVLEK